MGEEGLENASQARTRVFVEPKVMVMLGATVLTTALTMNPLIPAAGAVGLGAVLWLNFRVRRQAEREMARKTKYLLTDPQLPPVLEAEYRALIEGMTASQRRLLEEIGNSNDLVRRVMENSLPAIRDLAQKQIALALKLRELTGYLRSVDAPGLEKEITVLRRRISSTADAVTTQGLKHALAAKEESRKVCQDLELGVERIHAHLESMQAALEKFRGQVVKMKSAEARSVTLESESVSQALSSLHLEVDTLTEGIEKVFARDNARQSLGGTEV